MPINFKFMPVPLALALSLKVFGASLLSPEEILEKAKKSRTEFVEAVGEVQRIAPTLSSKEAFFPYIKILDDLKKIGDSFGAAEMGEDIVQSLGYILTRNGIKWLRLDVDSQDFIELYFRWSENSTRYQVAGTHIKLLVLVVDKENLIFWFERTTFALDFVSKMKSEAYVQEAFEQLQANCLQRLMKIRQELQPEQILDLLKKTTSLLAIQSVLAFLNEEGLKTTNPDDLETYLKWTAILGANLQAINQVVPFYILSAPGQLLITIVTKFLTLNRPFDSQIIPAILKTLLPSQIPNLGSTVMAFYKDKFIHEEIIDLLVILSSQLFEEYLKLNLGNETQEMRKFLSQVTLLQAGLSNQIEGSYEVIISEKPGLINFIHLGNGKFFMGISVRYGGEVSADFSFFYVTFNTKTQSWEAAHYDPSDPVSSNPVNEVFYTTFKIIPESSGNAIEGTMFTAKLTSPYRGRKTGGYLQFNSDVRDRIPEVAGVYRGEDRGYQFRLLIYQVEQRLQGVILVTSPTNIPVNVDLEYGYYDPRRNVAYLTSGRFESLRWVQVRGEFFDSAKRFEGQYVQSVYGVIHHLALGRSEGESHGK
ncbi:MAG: hypothetical protein ACKN9V_02200 [Pseudomonadota bacterium]